MSSLLVYAVVIGACTMCAYPQTDAWDTVRAISPGHKIRVHTGDKKQKGTLLASSEDTLRLQTGSGEIAVPRSEVTRVYSQSKSHRLRNVIIGTVVGVAAGAVLYGTLGTLLRNESSDDTAPLLLAPAFAGLGIGGAIPTGRMKLVYDAKKK
jgi:hypothetical protein